MISKYCLSVIKPFTGTIIYILYAYYWEKYQADFYNREIQALQIKTDIIFAVLAAVLFINFEGERIFYQYRISIRECLFLARIFIQECEEEYKQKLLVLFFFLMPVWVTIFSVIGGVLFKLVFGIEKWAGE